MKITSKRVEFGFTQMETCILLSVMVSAGVRLAQAASLSKHGALLVQEHRCAAAEQAYQEMRQDTQKNAYA